LNELIVNRKQMKRILLMYIDGFKNLTSLGKTLWIIILVKLFVMFVLLKIFFFPDYLGSRFSNDDERSSHITNNLIQNQ